MQRIILFLFCGIISVACYGQSSSEIVRELQNTLLNYNIWPYPRGSYKLKSVSVDYNAPIVTISFVGEYESSGTHRLSQTVIFDVLKSNFSDNSYLYSYSNARLEIYNQSGVEVKEYHVDYPMYGRSSEKRENKLPQTYYLPCSSNAISARLVNAFKNLKALAKEENVNKSSPNILDNAELTVQKVSFVAPDESGKLKANQTGCIKVEVKNTESNNALEVSCIVSEKNKSELFAYEQYTTIDKIDGYETGIINVPIKASENIDNNTYQFEVKVSYKGRTLKQETISITTSNPRKQQIVSAGTGGTNRNKTVRMRKMSGNTYLVSCKVNGLPLDFIFDTGASSVTLSRKQAQFMLRNGYLSRSDIVGSSSYQTASGDIATGMVIKLKRIEISGLVLNNVEATIINSDSAPLLLGQSALSRLGKIQIDYRNSTLTIIR